MTDSFSNLAYSSTPTQELSPVRRFIRHFDWLLFADTMLLACLGLLMVYSASTRFGHPGIYLGKQFVALVLGMVLLFLFATVNYQIFSQYTNVIFGF